MNKDRLWILAGAVGIIAVLALGWVIGVSPVLSLASDASSQSSALSATNDASLSRLAVLKKQYDDIDTVRAELADLRKSIPSGAQMPTMVTEINGICAKYHVTLASVTVNDAAIYVAPVSATDTAAAATDAAASTATPTPTPTATTTTTTPAATTTTTSTGLVTIPISVSVKGTFANVMKFVGAMQMGDRLFLVTQVGVTAAADDTTGSNSGFTGVVTGAIFSLTGQTDTAAATPAPEPTATETPTPTSTPTGTPGSTSTSTATP